MGLSDFAAARRVLAASVRAATRVWQASSPIGAATTPGQRRLAVAQAVLDLALPRVAPGLASGTGAARLLVDLVDGAVWAAVTPASRDAVAATLPSTPGLVELGRDRGLAVGLGWAATHAVAVAAVRTATTGRARPVEACMPLLAAVAGALLRTGEQREAARRDAARAAWVTAGEREAERQGRTAAVQALAGVHDAVQEVFKFAPSGLTHPLRAEVQARKQEWFAARSDVPLLVGTALADYTALRRRATRVLDEMVWFEHVVGEDGDVLLDADQVRALWVALDRAQVRGRVRSATVGTDRTGTVWVLVGEHTVAVPPARRVLPRPGLGATAVAAQGLIALHALNSDQRLPPVVPLVASAGALLTALVAEHRRGLFADEPSLGVLLTGATASGLWHAVGGQALMRPGDEPRFSGPNGLMAWLAVCVVTADATSRSTRALLAAGGLTGLAGSWVLAQHRDGQAFLSELLWPTVWAASAAATRRDLEAALAEHRAARDLEQGRLLAAARRRGVQEELRYARGLLDREDALLAGWPEGVREPAEQVFVRAREAYDQAVVRLSEEEGRDGRG